jgi:hypothetical protein
VYVDSNGIVQGYCVGSGCSQEILNKLAKDIFGVELGQEWVGSSGGDPPPDIDFDPFDIEP